MYPVTHLVVNSQNPDCAPVLPPALGTRRRARRAERDWRAETDGIAIRVAAPADAGALAELAQVDGAPLAAARLAHLAEQPSEGVVLVAEFHGHPAAALDVARDAAVADPFEPTAALVDLLRVRARQLGGRREGGLRALRPRLQRA